MKTLVSDTSVLIDLNRGVFVEPTFPLPFECAVPDLLHERELRVHGGPEFVRMGLRIEELDGDGVALALGYRRKRRSLSLPDSLALALAKKNAWTLLSGDRELRELSREEDVRCHGLLWLLDQMFEHRIIDQDGLRAGLGKIAADPRCLLPRTEIRKRLIAHADC